MLPLLQKRDPSKRQLKYLVLLPKPSMTEQGDILLLLIYWVVRRMPGQNRCNTMHWKDKKLYINKSDIPLIVGVLLLWMFILITLAKI